MGLKKETVKDIALREHRTNNGTEVIEKTESGTQAALERLKGGEIKPIGEVQTGRITYKQRDFDKEARGKVKCVMFEAALQSPAIAGLQFSTLEEYLVLVEKAANAGVEYTWKE